MARNLDPGKGGSLVWRPENARVVMNDDRRYLVRTPIPEHRLRADVTGGWIVLLVYVVAFVGGPLVLLDFVPRVLHGATSSTWLAIL